MVFIGICGLIIIACITGIIPKKEPDCPLPTIEYEYIDKVNFFIKGVDSNE